MALSPSTSMVAQPLSCSQHNHHSLLFPPFSFISLTSLSLSSKSLRLSLPIKPKNRNFRSSSLVVKASTNSMIALIFDCDGVILESEDLHRQAYNDAFAFFNVRCPSSKGPLNWDVEFYDVLQNRIGGGKPKMRTSRSMDGQLQQSLRHHQKQILIDQSWLMFIQDWKTERYQEIIKSGSVQPRPGVLRLMDEAKAAGKKLAVCSAATKSSVILTLESLIGLDRFNALDCFLAELKCNDLAAVIYRRRSDDVKEKKPDPSIYLAAAKKLGVSGKDCLVVEDSVIGLQLVSVKYVAL
ncbi:hypothetical protein RDABS01_004870 [Bienertia sinuspersici]